MIVGMIAGRIGKDAEVRQTTGGPVASFSVAVDQYVKKERITTWVRCSFFGKRGESVAKFLTKGSPVAVAGELTLHEYNGKTSLECRVNEVTLQGGKREGSAAAEPAYDTPSDGGAGGSAAAPDDQIPFVSSSYSHKEDWT